MGDDDSAEAAKGKAQEVGKTMVPADQWGLFFLSETKNLFIRFPPQPAIPDIEHLEACCGKYQGGGSPYVFVNDGGQHLAEHLISSSESCFAV